MMPAALESQESVQNPLEERKLKIQIGTIKYCCTDTRFALISRGAPPIRWTRKRC
jgi:hypothetical protein